MTFSDTRAALKIAATLDESDAAFILTFAEEPEAKPARCEEIDPWRMAKSPAHVEAARIVSRYVAIISSALN